MVSNVSDPGPSAQPSPAAATGEIMLQQMYAELLQLRSANEALQGQVQSLLHQRGPAPVLSPPASPSPLKAKPSTFDGKECMLEGWLSSTRDILVDCYGLSEEGQGMIRAARIYLQGPARTSWDALVRASNDPGGGLANWQAFVTWIRATHGTAAPQVVQGTLLMRLKQKGGSLQRYINKWNEHAAQLPIHLSDEVAQLWFVENLDDDYHHLASQYRVAHPSCTLQDIMQYLRMVNVDGRSRGVRQSQDKDRTTPMEVDLAAISAQLSQLERRLTERSEATVNRLTGDALKEHIEKGLCFTCSLPGHHSDRCPKLKEKKNKRKGFQQRR